MTIFRLTLPHFIEPPARIPVVARYSGPVLAAMRRPAGYRFTEPGRTAGGDHPWLDRPALRRT